MRCNDVLEKGVIQIIRDALRWVGEEVTEKCHKMSHINGQSSFLPRDSDFGIMCVFSTDYFVYFS
jgi:hypothetical protein